MGGTVGRLWCPGGAMPTDEEQALLGDSKKTDDPVAVKEVKHRPDFCSRLCDTVFHKSVAHFLLAALTFFGFMGVSAAAYHYIEGWDWTESIYFCVVVLTSVGYGDITPVTKAGKAFTIFFIFLSFTIVFACFGVIISTVSDWSKEEAKKHISKAKDKIRAKPPVGKALVEGVDGTLRDLGEKEERPEWMNRTIRHTTEIGKVALIFLATLGSGALLGHLAEGWDALDSWYWATVTVSTVGFGDLTLNSKRTRWAVLIYIICAVSIFAAALGRLLSCCLDWYAEVRIAETFENGLSPDLLANLEQDGDGSIERHEFITYMLVEMGRTSREDIEKILDMFDKLDVDGSGKLDIEDIKAANAKQMIDGPKGGAARFNF
eukprot:Transcript_15943.p1 GENE.Transcript_15943~~Transcript_15943.p1  ORF type:complete len:376 (+),score=102.39 Transcript_15943:85-1212(+)